MTDRRRPRRHRERGQILALTGISLIALCALIALAVDAGFFFDHKRRMQTAADSAAMAGARQLRIDTSGTKVQTAAFNAAASNGFTNGVDGTQVSVNRPPSSGFYAGNSAFVEAIITQPRATIFMNIVGVQSATPGARAVAGSRDSQNCIYALNKTLTKSLNMNGGFGVNTSCGVVVDSKDGDALDESGGACLTAASIAVTGNVTGSCFPQNSPRTGVPPEPDPLAWRAAPSFPATTYNNVDINSGTRTLMPGVYNGGITIKSGGGAVPTNVTFSPGVYVLNGGGLKVTGGTINGTGVTFYNTGTTSGPTKYAPVEISGNPTGTLSAPTSGAMEAMLFFQDRAISSGQANTLNGGAGLTLEGTLYFPTTQLKFAGGQSVTGPAAYTVLIADTIVFTGSSVVRNDYSSLSNGDPIRTVALAE